MEGFEIYDDIAKRTGGDIYVGVVGPVRTGKSTFISKFMQSSILNNIKNQYEKQRVIDEMPQSGAGATVMTMQPKFVPNEAVEVDFGSGASARVRLVDCVGYKIDGANGFFDGDVPRMVKTPWSENAMTFEDAAEIGTHKVISEHSTIAVLVTTDGTIAGIPRINYEKAEERVVSELKANNKPFVVVLNSQIPNSKNTKELADSLRQKYDVPVLPIDVTLLDASQITTIIKTILLEFPITKISFSLPKWVRALPYEDELITKIMDTIKLSTQSILKMSDYLKLIDMFDGFEEINSLEVGKLDLSNGEILLNIPFSDSLYYQILSKECGENIENDFHLMRLIKELAAAKKEYNKLKNALDTVKETGYGVVCPEIDDLELKDPEIITKGSNSSLKLRASAPSLHIMRVDVDAEICPAVGSVEQSGSLVSYMMNEVENNKQEIWNKNMFGKPMNELVKDSIDSKIAGIPQDVQVKMRKTMTKIVNERKGGVICILL